VDHSHFQVKKWTTASGKCSAEKVVRNEEGRIGRRMVLPSTPHPTPYTLHPTPHTLHPTPYSLRRYP